MTIETITAPEPEGKRAIPIDAINTLAIRLRQLQPEVLEALAESIKMRGQLAPIIVRAPKPGRIEYTLVVGLHRIEALKRLGRKTVLAEVRTLTDDQAVLIEIDENLVRAELSPSQRAVLTDRRKEIYERAHPEAKRGKAPGKVGGGKKAKNAKLASFAEDTAKKTGQSKRTIARDAARGKKVVVLADTAGTSLDTGVELDALAKLPPDEQRELAARAKAGEKISAAGKRQQDLPKEDAAAVGSAGEARDVDLENQVRILEAKILGFESEVSEFNSEVAKLNTLLREAVAFIAAGYRSNDGNETEMQKDLSPELFALVKPELARLKAEPRRMTIAELEALGPH